MKSIEHKKALAKERNKRYRAKHREELNTKQRERYNRDADFRKRSIKATKKWYLKARLKIMERDRFRRAALRAELIAEYGGRCACCRETTPEFLQVDHVHGGGGEHRRQMNGAPFYPWLRRHGYPKDKFRLLCVNCNFSLGRYGYCPHQKKKLEAV